jgi:putative addiction module component (TIGR02574 family)
MPGSSGWGRSTWFRENLHPWSTAFVCEILKQSGVFLEDKFVTATSSQILRQALDLDPVDRAELIDKLLHSFDAHPDESYADAWRAEAESRIDAFEAGQLTDDSVEAVLKRINRR